MKPRVPASLLGGALVAAFGLSASPVLAQDECDRDEDCVELYTEDFQCAEGALGRYCVEEIRGDECWDCWMDDPCAGGACVGECEDDADCTDAGGEGWVCVHDPDGAGSCQEHECDVDADCAGHGPGFACVSWWSDATICEREDDWVPPFRSCASAPVDLSGRGPGVWLGLAMVALAALRRPARRGSWHLQVATSRRGDPGRAEPGPRNPRGSRWPCGCSPSLHAAMDPPAAALPGGLHP